MAFAKVTWIAQLVLHGLVIALAVSILGVSGHLLQNHNSQAEANPWYLPMWPQHFDNKGIKATVGATSAIVFFGIVVLVMAFLPRFASSKSSVPSLLVFATTLPAAVLTITTIILTASLNNNAPVTDTIQTWTCRWSDYAATHGGSGASQNNVPNDFKKMCTESRFAFYGLIPLFILQVILLFASAVGFVAMLCSSGRKSEDGGMTPIKEQPESMGGVPAYEMDYRSGKSGSQVNTYGVP
ncbi:MAG: hypothetical protein M1820_005121 [Bogoriella megaspora]|nr:MAG: hypothetical protein M1820_005121 [Bogoriella megaspora]